jgi:surface protein
MHRYTTLIGKVTSGQTLFKHTKWLMFFTLFSLLSACGGGNGEAADPDSQAPIITLNGDIDINVTIDDDYQDLGAIAQDNIDGNITITTVGQVDTSALGTYIITYTATDSAGNSIFISRTVNVLERDLTPLVITLNGAAQVSIREDTRYSELGAIAVDAVNGPVDVVISSNINAATPGSYIVNYSAVDSAGNRVNVTRTVNVIDATAPVITLNGQRVLRQNEDTAYTEVGASATDNLDLTVDVVISGTLNPATPGTYTLTYTATDMEGNTATTTRTITFSDITPPVIMLVGASNITTSFNSPYTDAGATATDNSGEIINVTVTGAVNPAILGGYELTYTATDAAGNTTSQIRTINIVDITAPVIILSGDNPLMQNDDTAYIEPGYRATDNSGEAITVIVSGAFTANTPGSYTLTYTASDSTGNTSTAMRIISVADVTPPVLTLLGEANINVPFNTPYTDAGATATDNSGEIINVTVTGAVNPAILGRYELTYTATDSATNTSTAMRTLNVVDITPPVITLNGSNAITIIQGRVYIDSATANDDVDGSVAVTISGDLDTGTIGSYTQNYTATDAAGNQSTLTRTITVREPLAFITYWKTDNTGSSDDNQITITTVTNDQNYTVDWGDNSQDTGVAGAITHTYSDTGIYIVSIRGDFKNIKFGVNTDCGKLLSIEQWGEGQWSTMASAFSGCANLILDATDVPDLSQVTDMSSMFSGATAFNGDISQWDLSSVMNMRSMFYSAAAFNGDISQWNVTKVTDMSSMFSGAAAFNEDISQWDVSKVTNMKGIFSGAKAFNGDISQWDVSQVENMGGMFNIATSFNGGISQWDVSNVTNMAGMFYTATSFNGDISDWDVSSVRDINSMFYSATSFNGDISRWDVSSVTNMSSMYYKATSFNGDISQWDVSNVTNMRWMFLFASAFNRDISDWDIIQVEDMQDMFRGVTLPTENYDALLQGWSSKILQQNVNFHGGNSQYSSAAQSARDSLLNTYGWTVNDGGLQVAP